MEMKYIAGRAAQEAEALLSHLDSVKPLLEEILKIAQITRLEIHGVERELAKLREPLAGLNPAWFTLEYGFRRQVRGDS